LQNAEHAASEACSDEISAQERATLFAIGVHPMPKAKPVSLFPFTFKQAIDVLIKAKPKPQKTKSTKRKNPK
jgi:hypothetical protein